MESPDTRPSLILRLPNLQDVHAWTEFAEIYEPLVYRLARRLGMEEADALEAKQEVMLHLTQVVETWRPTPEGSFRGWLYRVARNVMLRHLHQRDKHVRGTGDTQLHAALQELPSAPTEADFDLEFQREAFAWAALRVREEVELVTWDAFYETYVGQRAVQDVATELGISPGNVYVARSRVMKRLRETVQRQVARDWQDWQQGRTSDSEAAS